MIKKYYLHILLLLLSFILSVILFLSDQFLFLDGARYYYLSLDNGGAFVTPHYWRFSTHLPQLGAYLTQLLLGVDYIALQFNLYSLGYSFQVFFGVVISILLIKKYDQNKLIYLLLALFGSLILTNIVFLQSIAIESVIYIFISGLILAYFSGSKIELVLLEALILLLTFGYELNIIPLAFIALISGLRFLKEQNNIWLIPTLSSIIGVGIILYASKFILPLSADDRVLKDIRNILFPFREANTEWFFFMLGSFIFSSVFSKYKKAASIIAISILFWGIYLLFFFDEPNGIYYGLILDAFPARIPLIPFASLTIPTIYIYSRHKQTYKPSALITLTSIGFVVCNTLVVSLTALEHRKGVQFLEEQVSKSSCTYIDDDSIIQQMFRYGVFSEFYGYYSIALAKSNNIQSIVFGKFEGWGPYKDKWYKKDICQSYQQEKRRFVFFEEPDFQVYFSTINQRLDFQPLLNSLGH